jgi:hypothetical protein
LFFTLVLPFAAVSLAQTGDVTVQFNGGGANNKVFIGEENTLQIFITNPGGAIYGMSLGFGFTSAVPGFSWKTPYGNKPLPPKPKYVQEYGDAVDKFDVGGFHCDMPSPPTPFLMGGAADVAPLPVHATSTMLYDLKLIMPADTGQYPGGFGIDNVFVPPAGAWQFHQGGMGGGYPPTFQGNGNTSGQIPDAPPVYFDIVRRGVDCDWQPGDPYQMHFPQLPNDSGWDVNATFPVVLADDWQCSQTGWVKDIHFWGSWKNGIVGQIQYFRLSICSDIPANPPQIPYSRSGETLWEAEITNLRFAAAGTSSMGGWMDLPSAQLIPIDFGPYFRYDICLDSLQWFRQVKNTIYWLNISAVLQDPETTKWGWKSSRNHWNDDAVWMERFVSWWVDLWEPSQPIQNQFYGHFDPQGMFMGGGSGYFGQGWYLYPTDWWNIWFYDHPFTYDRGNVIRIECDFSKVNPLVPPFIGLAVNWSTDQWSLDQPPQDSMPPLPGVSEQLYIGRDTLLYGFDLTGHYVFDYVIRDYNPEWVSVDVMGNNFMVDGTITYDCRPSLDLSFVITNGDTLTYRPGDANGDAAVDISDAVYQILYIFSGGPAPAPLLAGDANCDCTVDISDVVYLIVYIFSGGPAPCICQQ